MDTEVKGQHSNGGRGPLAALVRWVMIPVREVVGVPGSPAGIKRGRLRQ